MSGFDRAFVIVTGHEGGFGADQNDPGNWTGGEVGKGELRGTKFGISAAAYPTVDIANLTLDVAAAIYRRDYWDRIGGDSMPPALALLVFDAAVNNGIERAIVWLQSAVGAEVDGRLGPATLARVAEAKRDMDTVSLCAEFNARRLLFMSGLPTWKAFGLGWARRLSLLPYQSAVLGEEN